VRIVTGLALDATVVCLFAAIGRRNHGESGALLAVATTAWPFLVGLAACWLVSLSTLRRAPLLVRDGIPLWLATVAIGMVLRHLAGAGTAVAFVVVAILFLGAGLLGWRVLAAWTTRPRS
jgi:hypothetical protein